ncbi:hypothetical protein JRG42_26405 [Pseudomonas granadensis]|uniref:hypothetical protein n=1 Tax=Pseudomonas granadensis TaxID=1421430 RepID=UPI0019CFF05D|nr:hypothetical protein [Pseudomonas granadensis]MBN6776842.1 hypothetical protein [Pseudomonas granadensis]MBN6808040.1 hypothetical protein [Pseudomonas granadensis]MBN6834708.1 hypothetical protein [Pseudomonas granadensis]MBN6842221.1 hypothetical protein [Pseudomonas granadensis]MBN6870947.1 hypothetical protein [Pseudomonas granadensis]
MRKKLRSTAQLLAHLAAGLARRDLQRIYPLKYYDQLRNFLRSWVIGHVKQFMNQMDFILGVLSHRIGVYVLGSLSDGHFKGESGFARVGQSPLEA